MPEEVAAQGIPDVHPRYKLTDAEREMLRDTWPLDLIEDPARHPRIIEKPEDFIRELLIGNHLEECVILPNGVELLDLSWEDVLPEDIRECLKGCKNTSDFVSRVRDRPEVLEKYRADIEYVDANRQQRDVLRKDKHDLGKRISEALRMAAEGAADPNLLYVAEMRLKKEAPHPIGGEKVKTVCRRDVKDVLGPYIPWTLYWDRYDEGFFAGGRGSGKGAHIDQVLWSNVGRNWHGYKLLAAWPKGEVSKQVALNFYDVLFSPPLKDREVAALRQAAKIVLLRPGDVYLFSGGIAHTVLCVSEEMCLGAYESMVSLNPSHVEHFLHTDDREGPYFLDKFSMCGKELKDTKDDCIDQLEDVADQLSQGGPTAAPTPVALLPATWIKIHERLHADQQLQATLREHYAKAIDLCRGDRHFRRHMPRKVLLAGEACGGGAADGVPGSSKRRRCSSPGAFDSPPREGAPRCAPADGDRHDDRRSSSSYSDRSGHSI